EGQQSVLQHEQQRLTQHRQQWLRRQELNTAVATAREAILQAEQAWQDAAPRLAQFQRLQTAQQVRSQFDALQRYEHAYAQRAQEHATRLAQQQDNDRALATARAAL